MSSHQMAVTIILLYIAVVTTAAAASLLAPLWAFLRAMYWRGLIRLGELLARLIPSPRKPVKARA